MIPMSWAGAARIASLLACATCFGDPGAAESRGLALGILLLVGVVVGVLLIIGRFLWRLLRSEATSEVGTATAGGEG